MTPSRRCVVLDASQPAEVRRVAAALAAERGFDETAVGAVALVVTEAATNLLKHAGGGEILLRVLPETERAIEVLALDKGRGMRNVAQCRSDGYSTSGSPGIGLGSIARLSAVTEIYSQIGRGTALLARLPRGPDHSTAWSNSPLIGGLTVALAGQTDCGDAWGAVARTTGTALVVVDGLGHGPLAAEAAGVALRAFQSHAAQAPGEVLEAMHASLRGTRGAAAAVVALDEDRALLTFAGVGNISGSVVAAGGSRRLFSHNGIVGHAMPHRQEFTYPWPRRAVLVLHSDGLTPHWRMDAYPGLEGHHPSLIAGVLYRDFARGRDDATVVVVKDGA